MTRLFYSLQFRLVLGFALVLALASVSFYVGHTAEQEVGRFENRREAAITARVQQMMAPMYSNRRNPEQVQSVLEQAGRLSGRRIILQDPDGEVVGDSHLRIYPDRQRPTAESGPVPILVAGREVWSFSVATDTDTDPGGIPEPAVASLVSTVNESLIWTGIAAGALGVLLVSIRYCRRSQSWAKWHSAWEAEISQNGRRPKAPASCISCL